MRKAVNYALWVVCSLKGALWGLSPLGGAVERPLTLKLLKLVKNDVFEYSF